MRSTRGRRKRGGRRGRERREVARLAEHAAGMESADLHGGDTPPPTHDMVRIYALGRGGPVVVRLYPVERAREIAAVSADTSHWVGRTRSDEEWRPVDPDALPAWAVEVGLWVGPPLDPGGITGMAQRVAAVDRRRRERWADSDEDARARRTEENHRAPVRSAAIRRR